MLPDTLAHTVEWFEKAVPEPDDRRLYVQMGVHFEEVIEMIEALTGINHHGKVLLDSAIFGLAQLANHLKNEPLADVILHDGDRHEMLDAIADQIVTGAGTAHFANLNVVGALKEVNRSNFSKFDTNGNPIFLPNGKIGKSPFYIPPDLTPYL